MHATLGRGLFVLLNGHFLLLKNRSAKLNGAKNLSRPSDGAFTCCMHGRQRQSQQNLIFNQFDKTQSLTYQNGITIGQRIQPLQFCLSARQIHHAVNFNLMPHPAQAALTGQLNLAMNYQPQRQAAQLICPSDDSTEQRTLRKFKGKTRELRHIRLGFPRLRILAKTPWVDLNRLQHDAPD
jgi:hypothetical protein